jgi:hypothetical protein
VKSINLDNNNLSAMDPHTFSNLSNLKSLRLHSNPCIDKDFDDNPTKAAIEQELAECGAGYALNEQQNSG